MDVDGDKETAEKENLLHYHTEFCGSSILPFGTHESSNVPVCTSHIVSVPGQNLICLCCIWRISVGQNSYLHRPYCTR